MADSNKVVEEIRQRINIVDVIKDVVSLNKKGKNHLGLCPFHTEKTPSFNVNEEKGFFYCFGCQESGDVFTFLMKYNNNSFYETLMDLGKRVGVEVKSSYQKDHEDQYYFLIDIYKEAAKVFQDTLIRSKLGSPGLDYLSKRYINDNSLNKFMLGYAPEDWTHLHHHLSKANYSIESQIKSGLIKRSKNQNSIDTFRHRVIFPIVDESNRIVAFGGRVLDKSQPKYLNSPENYYFKKRDILYGLNLAKQAIKDEGKAIIVEGYFDVIMAHQMGIENVVAPLGTGLTQRHIQKLKRYTDKMILVFDGDPAGEKAMIRGLSHTLKADIETMIVTLSDGMDPCDYLLNNGSESFMQLLGQAKPALDYRIEWGYHKMPDDSDFHKRQYLNDLYSFLNSLDSEVQKEEGLKKAAILLKISDRGIQKDYMNFLNKGRSKKVFQKASADSNTPSSKLSPRHITERYLIFTLLNHLEFFLNYKNRILSMDLEDSFSQKLFSTMAEAFSDKEKLEAQDLHLILEALDEEDKALVSKELLDGKYQAEPIQQIQDCFKRLKLYEIKPEQASISRKISEAQRENTVDLDELLEERQFLANEENKLKQREKATWKD